MNYPYMSCIKSLYLESKLITSKNFMGTYFGHMVTISDLGAGPQSRPLPLVYPSFNLPTPLKLIYNILFLRYIKER